MLHFPKYCHHICAPNEEPNEFKYASESIVFVPSLQKQQAFYYELNFSRKYSK